MNGMVMVTSFRSENTEALSALRFFDSTEDVVPSDYNR